MALPVQDQLKYWGITAAVFAALLWFLGDVLLPFVIGGAVAYCLDPVADRLERMGFSRAIATAIITVIGMVLFIIIALAILPLLIQQAASLFNTAPQLIRDFITFLETRFPAMMNEGGIVQESLATFGDTIREKGGALVNTALSSVASLLNLVTLFLIAPVVGVYLLLDWDRMVAQIDALLPRDHKNVLRQLAREIDRVLAGFIRGMGSVCLILGIYYSIALWLVGLNFGLVVGVIAGMLTFIPYVGAIVGGGLSIGLALFQYWGAIDIVNAAGEVTGTRTDWVRIIIVYAIFQSGQFAEGNILTPRLVGNSVGLHPVWLLLSLSVFGSLFGFIGLLVAVPLAAAIGVMARFGIVQYTQSRLYRGLEALKDQDPNT